MDNDQKAAAYDLIREKMSEIDTWMWTHQNGIAGHLTCGEANCLCDILELLELEETAQILRSEHAEADEEGDEHYVGT